MKKVLVFLVVFMSVASNVFAGDFNPNAMVVDAKNLHAEYEQNKFAFAKKYKDKEVVVAGFVDKVTEEQVEAMKGPKVLSIHNKGLFHALLVDQNDIPDPAEINQNDATIFMCSKISEGDIGLYVKGFCKPVALTRKVNNQTQIMWVTKDNALIESVFSPELAKGLQNMAKQ